MQTQKLGTLLLQRRLQQLIHKSLFSSEKNKMVGTNKKVDVRHKYGA